MSAGINQSGAQVSQAVSSMAQSAVNAGRATLGIASPSKVFQQMGADSAEGYAAGVQANTGSVSQAGATLGQLAIQAAQQGVYEGSSRLTKINSSGDHWHEWVSSFVSPHQAAMDEKLVGAFGSGVATASDGVTPIAQSYGLLVGTVWARSVMTGVDNVLTTSDFASLVAPQFGSALAQSTLGADNLLPPAGSGAAYYNTTQGNAGTVTMTQPTVNIGSVVAQFGSQQLTGVISDVVDAKFTATAKSIGGQRG